MNRTFDRGGGRARGFEIALIAAVIAALLLAGCGESGQAAGSADRVGQAQRSIERFLDDVLPAGASGTLVAARDGKKVYCRGFGLSGRKARILASCDTVYDIMSMTKQFTAAGDPEAADDGQAEGSMTRSASTSGRYPRTSATSRCNSC